MGQERKILTSTHNEAQPHAAEGNGMYLMHYELLPPGKTVNSSISCQQLSRLQYVIGENQLVLVEKGRCISSQQFIHYHSMICFGLCKVLLMVLSLMKEFKNYL